MTAPQETPSAYELAVRIAAHMKPWAPKKHQFHDENPHCAYLRHNGTGAEIIIHIGDGWVSRGRVGFSGCWPQYADGRSWSPTQEERLTVTVAEGRDPKTIAREIEKRLLPTYEAAYARALQAVREGDRGAAEATAAAERICAEFGRGAESDENNVRPARSLGEAANTWVRVAGVYQVSVQPGDEGPRVSFKVENIDEAAACGVLRLLQNADEPRKLHALLLALPKVYELLVSLGDYTGNVDKRTGIDRTETCGIVADAMGKP